MPERSALTLAILDVLADGQWHSREDIGDAVGGVIPPGVAYREAERRRLAEARRGGEENPARQKNRDPLAVVRSGAAALVRNRLEHLVREGVILRTGTRSDVRYIRDDLAGRLVEATG